MRFTWLRRRLGDYRLEFDWYRDTWARGEAKRLQRSYLRRTWWAFPTILALTLIVLMPLYLQLGSAGRWFVIGALAASTPWFVAYVTVFWSGSASLWAGESAEVSSAAELAPLLKRDWRVLANPMFSFGDVDLVAVGPGGVIVLETKYRRERPASADLEAAARQLRGHRRDVTGIARRGMTSPPVVACLVYWGPFETELPMVREDGIHVIRGKDLRGWVSSQAQASMTADCVEAVYRELSKDAERRRTHLEGAPRP